MAIENLIFLLLNNNKFFFIKSFFPNFSFFSEVNSVYNQDRRNYGCSLKLFISSLLLQLPYFYAFCSAHLFIFSHFFEWFIFLLSLFLYFIFWISSTFLSFFSFLLLLYNRNKSTHLTLTVRYRLFHGF